MNAAVLIACHNRREATLKCLSHLYKSLTNARIDFQIFLVDDASSDGTSGAVSKIYPDVNIILGTGNLFWNQGMRLAWEAAVSTSSFDFFIWINDDTYIDDDAVSVLFSSYLEKKNEDDKEVIISGLCRSAEGSDQFSYGGRDHKGRRMRPAESPQLCRYINGNFVLVSMGVYKEVGILSNNYTHAMGDFDYSLRAHAKKIKSYTTSKYVATCKPNEGVPNWADPSLSLAERIDFFRSPKGLNIKEYIIFRKKFWPITWPLYVMKAYFRVLFPKFYQRLNDG